MAGEPSRVSGRVMARNPTVYATRLAWESGEDQGFACTSRLM